VNPKDSGLSITYTADDQGVGAGEIKVSPTGDVVIGVPVITSIATPPDDEQKENV
jgi:hypothetical protein